MLKKSGVAIVAIGHPYYGRMAFNLAKTIKAVDNNCPIQLITNGNALNHVSKKELFVFDYITDTEITNGFECKLHIDLLSEFENTLLLDADCVWVNAKSPIYHIEMLEKSCNFTGITEGMHNFDNQLLNDINNKYYFWADLAEMQQKYDLSGVIYQWRTECMYLKQCEQVKDLFETARYVYANANQLTSIKMFAHNVPDELAFNISACVHKMHPHKYKWRPSFWHRLYGETAPQIDELKEQYLILSCGSNTNTGNVKKIYDRIVKAASYKLGLQHVFQLINKREMMPSRQQM